MQIWRLVHTQGNSGFYNMAVDEAIAIACREGVVHTTLRFYTWYPPCVSIGYFQKYKKELEAGPDMNNLPIVRRLTGGRAVFHGNDLSYSIISTTDNNLFPPGIKGTYYAIAEALVTGLKYLGISPDPLNALDPKHGIRNPASGKKKPELTPLCFDTALGHEICVDGKKLIGSAQRRWSNVFLQHGSILTEFPMDGGLNTASLSIPMPVINEIIASICAGFCDVLGIKLVEEGLTQYEKGLAEKLSVEKYSRTSWNLKYV